MKTFKNKKGLQNMHTSLITADNESQIASFFVGKSVFITGATGFMGKVLVEKLLRSCKGVERIYVLMRNKKGIKSHNRLNELFNSKAFERLRKYNPEQLNKVIAIPGDITLPGLGISKTDLDLLTQNVSIVFHSAATVKFDKPLLTAINYNTRGTQYLLDVCHKMEKLMALVHVSTAYSNCNLPEVNEQLYSSPAPPKKIIEMTEWMDEATLDNLTPELLGKRPNTYTYTKALAETLLADEAGSIPVAIVRPSVVTAAWQEPFPGWVDNINGITGMMLASGKGMLRSMLCDPKAVADLIPVDIVINLMVTVAWYTATTRPKSINIYNCTSGTLNSIKWRDVERNVISLWQRFPSNLVFRYPCVIFTESRKLNDLCCILDHLVPAYGYDSVMRLVGKKPTMVRLYEKLHQATDSLKWFTTRSWRFKSNNVIKMSQKLNGIDKKTFHFDVRDLNWDSYWQDYILGIRKFLLKEDEESLPGARRKLQIAYYTPMFFWMLMIFGLCFMLIQAPFVETTWTETVSGVKILINEFLFSSSEVTSDTSALI